jgi:hypothetical protein
MNPFGHGKGISIDFKLFGDDFKLSADQEKPLSEYCCGMHLLGAENGSSGGQGVGNA